MRRVTGWIIETYYRTKFIVGVIVTLVVALYVSTASYAEVPYPTRTWVHLSTGAGFEYRSSLQTLGGFWEYPQHWLAGDFNGDGKDDLVNVYGTGYNHSQARLLMYLATGSGFEQGSSFQTLAGFWDSQRWLVGDFNGDGKDDLVNVYQGSGNKATAWVHLSTGSGFEYQSSFQRFAGFWDSQRWLVGDFNGDGKDDLVDIYRGIIPKPEAPNDLRITKVSERTLSLEWKDNAVNEDGFKISRVGKREGYQSDNNSTTLDEPDQESYVLKNLYEGYRYCITVQAYNRGGTSLTSNEVCETIPISKPPPPPTEGYKQVAIFNCHNERRTVDMWTFDITAGTWSEHGTLSSQWSGGSCPASASPLLVPLMDGHSYDLVAVDPSLLGCDGENNPEHTFCQKLLLKEIYGADDGPTLPVTVN